MTMRTEVIHVIGCNHGIQEANEDDFLPIDDLAEIRTQRLSFGRLLEEIVTDRKIQFVGEEWGLPRPSTAQILSNKKGISWANINTSLEDLHRMEIPQDYVQRRYGPAAKDHWNYMREEFMVRRILERKGSAQYLLVVCGFHHLQAMARLLADRTCSVQTIDYRALDWYRAGIFSDDE